MSRHITVLAVVLLGCLATTALAADNSKTGTIKSVDAKAKTFVLAVTGGRDLTLTVNDKTALTLDGKETTFGALKADQKATVAYAKAGDDRVASKVEATSPTPAN